MGRKGSRAAGHFFFLSPALFLFFSPNFGNHFLSICEGSAGWHLRKAQVRHVSPNPWSSSEISRDFSLPGSFEKNVGRGEKNIRQRIQTARSLPFQKKIWKRRNFLCCKDVALTTSSKWWNFEPRGNSCGHSKVIEKSVLVWKDLFFRPTHHPSHQEIHEDRHQYPSQLQV